MDLRFEWQSADQHFSGSSPDSLSYSWRADNFPTTQETLKILLQGIGPSQTKATLISLCSAVPTSHFTGATAEEFLQSGNA
jgi:hypothetical protein